MKQGMINIICFALAGFIALGTFVIYQNGKPLEVDLPVLAAQPPAQEGSGKEQTPEAALRARQKRWASCKADDDCIIVEKDPCGCVAGPTGVTAINVNYALEFDKHNQNKTVSCPEQEPSQEGPCSPEAQPVCQNKVCTIVF